MWVWWWIVMCGGVMYAAGWWVSSPMLWWLRWGFRLALLALLSGLLLPADVINSIIAVLSHLIPGLGEITDEPSASFGMHFILFLAVASLLLPGRLDLAVLPLLGALIVLAFITEAIQIPIPNRTGDWFDVGTNLLGVGVGWVIRWGVDLWREHPRGLGL